MFCQKTNLQKTATKKIFDSNLGYAFYCFENAKSVLLLDAGVR